MKTAYVMISVVESMPKPDVPVVEPTEEADESSPVGLIVGIACGAVAVIGAVAFVLLRKKGKKSVVESAREADENKNE